MSELKRIKKYIAMTTETASAELEKKAKMVYCVVKSILQYNERNYKLKYCMNRIEKCAKWKT